MSDAPGGDELLANGSIVPLTMAGAAYTKGQQVTEESDEPEEQPEEQEETTGAEPESNEPDDADNAEDEETEGGGE